MKRIIFTLLIILLTEPIFSQSVHPVMVDTSNIWHQYIFYTTSPDFNTIKYRLKKYSGGDSNEYRFFKSDEYGGNRWDSTDIVLKQIDQKVFINSVSGISKNEEFMLIHDFSLEVGDTFKSKIFDDKNQFLIVDKTDSITLEDGIKRKRLSLSCYTGSDTVGFGGITWIEGIGSIKHFIYVESSCYFDAVTVELLCFYQNDIQLWHNENHEGCWLAEVDDVLIDKFTIFPNPVENFLTIVSKDKKSVLNWSIYNVSGQKIRESTGLEQGISEISVTGLNELSKGLYILKILDSDSNIGIRKFVVE